MATLEYPYRFLRHIPTNQVAAIFLEETPCDDEGFPMTDNNTWATSYHETPEYFESNAINSHHGHVNRFPTRFSKSEWKITLDPSEPILAIHIPAGSPLSHEAVDNAFQLAAPFFPKYYPDIPFRGMTCTSWMMYPQLFHYLPPSSNLAYFARQFTLVPIPKATDNQHFERIFKAKPQDWRKLTAATSLQRIILDHCKAGKKWRMAMGFHLIKKPADTQSPTQ